MVKTSFKESSERTVLTNAELEQLENTRTKDHKVKHYLFRANDRSIFEQVLDGARSSSPAHSARTGPGRCAPHDAAAFLLAVAGAVGRCAYLGRKPTLAEKRGAHNVRVFGSTARGHQQPGSDFARALRFAAHEHRLNFCVCHLAPRTAIALTWLGAACIVRRSDAGRPGLRGRKFLRGCGYVSSN